jgi:hypothetical protein
MQTPAAIKLPVLTTVLRSWSTVPRNLGLMLRLVWPWLAIMMVCILSIAVGILVNNGRGTPSPFLIGGASAIPGIMMLIAFLLALPAIAVGWHRGIIAGERPETTIVLDGGVWGYVGYSLLLAVMAGIFNLLMFALVSIVAGISVGVGEGPMSIERLTALAPFLPIAFLPTLLVLNRFLLVLPATATGKTLSFGEALRLTRGNTLRLTLVAGIVSLPIALVQGVTQLASLSAPGPALAGVLGIINLAVLIFCSFASLSFLSLALRELTMMPEQQETLAVA